MGTVGYSGATAAEPAAVAWRAPRATGPLDLRMTLPGSKSLTARELVLAALADGPSTIRRPLHSRDSWLMVDALRALGTSIEEVPGDGGFGPDLRVVPARLAGPARVHGGLAGTVLRFIAPVAALADGLVAVDGDEAARRRPVRPVIEALRALGVRVDDEGEDGQLPFTVHGTGSVGGGELSIDASASSQFVSALLLAAPRFEAGLALRHTGARLPSQPHIEMTLAALRARDVSASSPAPGVWRVEPGPIAAVDTVIEPDLSNAAPFLAAALVAGGRVAIGGWPEATTQVGDSLRELLPRYGATVSRRGDAVVVEAPGVGAGPLPAVDLDLSEGGELAPTFAALAALGAGPARLTGIGHLRGHETDRLAALAEDLGALGAAVRILDDGLEIAPAPLHGGRWRSFADHRIATTGALLGLVVDGVELDDVATTAKTLPEFPQLWAALVASGTPA